MQNPFRKPKKKKNAWYIEKPNLGQIQKQMPIEIPVASKKKNGNKFGYKFRNTPKHKFKYKSRKAKNP